MIFFSENVDDVFWVVKTGIALLKFREKVVNDPYGALTSWKQENGEANPCSWFGIGCVGGHVVSL